MFSTKSNTEKIEALIDKLDKLLHKVNERELDLFGKTQMSKKIEKDLNGFFWAYKDPEDVFIDKEGTIDILEEKVNVLTLYLIGLRNMNKYTYHF